MALLEIPDSSKINYLYSYITGITTLFIFLWLYGRPKRNLPPGPIGLPVVGYLPFLGKEPFKVLNKLCEKHGNIISLYLGRTLVIILGDYAAVKEAFSKSTTLDRPEHLFDFLPGGVGFSSVNGQEWYEQRRHSVRIMNSLGLGKGPWETLIQDEVDEFIKEVHKLNGKPTNICRLLTESVASNIMSLVLGKKIPRDSPQRALFHNSIDTVSQFFSQAGIRNYFPTLVSWLVKLGITEFHKLHNQMVTFNEIIKKEVEDHNKSPDNNPDNFIDMYQKEMKVQKDKKPQTSFNETNLYGNMKGLIVGGSDTTRTSLNWLLITMAEYPDIQDKVHKELDNVLGDRISVTWEDRLRTPYTYATIMEGQRWKTIAPLNTSCIAQEDIVICGYDVPKGSTIIANNWSLHNDKKYWNDPEKFSPEHFMTNDNKEVVSKPESYVPFSYGKRNCPGETIAMMEMYLYFSALMKDFEVLPPKGQKPKLEAILGLTYQAVKQELRLVPRTSSTD